MTKNEIAAAKTLLSIATCASQCLIAIGLALMSAHMISTALNAAGLL